MPRISLLLEHMKPHYAVVVVGSGYGGAIGASRTHLALPINVGHLVNFAGEDVYLPHLDRLALPITFIHGADNECYEPKSTEITYDLLCQTNGKELYFRHVIPGYGHIDCIFGKNASNDVFPIVLNALEKGNTGAAKAGGA
jgi:cholesterol oxidase